MSSESCCCWTPDDSDFAPLVSGDTGQAEVREITCDLLRSDRVGFLQTRLGIGRMLYSVQPGLYRVGKPDKHSPVLVTANYKLTVDLLRRELRGVNAWVLVLNTGGINVGCGAGKDTRHGTRLRLFSRRMRMNVVGVSVLNAHRLQLQVFHSSVRKKG